MYSLLLVEDNCTLYCIERFSSFVAVVSWNKVIRVAVPTLTPSRKRTKPADSHPVAFQTKEKTRKHYTDDIHHPFFGYDTTNASTQNRPPSRRSMFTSYCWRTLGMLRLNSSASNTSIRPWSCVWTWALQMQRPFSLLRHRGRYPHLANSFHWRS